MQVLITIEDSVVTIHTDDGKVVNIVEPAVELPKPQTIFGAPENPKLCGYCRRKGSPCSKHGGKPSYEKFSDPWDCDTCRAGQMLCVLHRAMSDQGKTPPKRFSGGIAQ